MSNNNQHEVQDKSNDPTNGEDYWREREDEEDDRWESYAEQQQYNGTDFRPSAGWYV